MQELAFAWRVETLRDKYCLTLPNVPDGTLLTLNNARELVVLSNDPYIVALSVQERAKLQHLIDANSISPTLDHG